VTAGRERARTALPRITANKIPSDGHSRPRVLMLMNQGQSRRLAARTPGGCLQSRALQEQAITCLTAQASNNVWCCVGSDRTGYVQQQHDTSAKVANFSQCRYPGMSDRPVY